MYTEIIAPDSCTEKREWALNSGMADFDNGLCANSSTRIQLYRNRPIATVPAACSAAVSVLGVLYEGRLLFILYLHRSATPLLCTYIHRGEFEKSTYTADLHLHT